MICLMIVFAIIMAIGLVLISQLSITLTHHKNMIRAYKILFEQTREANEELCIRIDHLDSWHQKMLSEIAQVTAIDIVELPTFGTVYLNHSKSIRETMDETNNENEE